RCPGHRDRGTDAPGSPQAFVSSGANPKYFAGTLPANHTIAIATAKPPPTSASRAPNMRCAVPVCGTSRMIVAVLPARRLAVATFNAQHTNIETTIAPAYT